MKNWIFIFALLFIFGCNSNGTEESTITDENKDTVDEQIVDEVVETTPTNEILIIGKWQLMMEGDEEAMFKDFYTYNADGTFEYEDSSIKVPGTWKIVDDHVLTYNTGNKSDWGKIISIDDKKMVLEDSITVYNNKIVDGKVTMEQVKKLGKVIYEKR